MIHVSKRLRLGILPFLLSILTLSAHAYSSSRPHQTQFYSKDIDISLMDPAEFHANSGPQKKWASEFVDKITLKGNEHILDAGCADGKITSLIASKVKSGYVIGVDLSPAMIDFATTTYSKPQPNLSFQQADLRSLPFYNKFDVAISTSTFHWLDNHADSIRGLANSLKPKGKLYLKQYVNTSSTDVLQASLDKVFSKLTWKGLFKSHSEVFSNVQAEEIIRLLKQEGFKINRQEVVKCVYYFKDREECIQWLMPWRRIFQRSLMGATLPEGICRKFAEDIVDAYLEIQPADDKGQILFTNHMLEVEATKG